MIMNALSNNNQHNYKCLCSLVFYHLLQLFKSISNAGLYLSVGSRVKYPPIIEKDPTILEVTKKKKKLKKKIILFLFYF